MRRYILLLSGTSLLFSCTTFTYEVKHSSTKTAVTEGFKENKQERPQNQSALFHIASFDEVSAVRKAAVERLTKQSSLFHIANFDQDSEVRKAAVNRLTSQSSLSHVANFDNDSEVRKLAIERMN